MALFSHASFQNDPTFTNLFRLLDDFDTYSRGTQGTVAQGKGQGRHGRLQVFSPKFDVCETDDAYELYGELPGIDKKDVRVEFTEPQNLVIHGRVERTYSSGNLAADQNQGTEASGSTTGHNDALGTQESTVEGTAGRENKAAETQGDTASEKPTTVAKTEESARPTERFWHKERSVGEFSRNFTFPSPVDNSAVSASLNDGVLHVTIPKAKKSEPRRIAVN
jgi:HSP20 family molecular chaperone IbpA